MTRNRSRLSALIVIGILGSLLPLTALPAGATTGDLVITGVVDGPLAGGLPKAVELYVANDIPDLSIYGAGSANNGNPSTGPEFTFPAIAATAGDFVYLATEGLDSPASSASPPTSSMLRPPTSTGTMPSSCSWVAMSSMCSAPLACPGPASPGSTRTAGLTA